MGEVVKSLAELRQTFKSGRTRSVAWRKNQLRALLDLISDKEEVIFEALHQDLGKHPVEAYRDEIGVVKKSASFSLNNVEKWMAPKKYMDLRRGLDSVAEAIYFEENQERIATHLSCLDAYCGHIPLLFFPAKGEVLPEPLGVVLLLSSWNFPISLALDPLIGAISAGNAVVLKLSENAPACSSFLAKTLPLYLDNSAIKVFEGGADVGNQLLQHKWDKIFFTGSSQVGRLVMTAAAKHLTPVTLELGGKCPAILDSLSNPSDMKAAVKRIVGAKWGACNGQACIAVDYVLVEDNFKSTLIELLKKTIKKFYGENPKSSKSNARIINKHHFGRLRNLLEDPFVADSIVHGGSSDEESLFIEPTILLNPPLDAEIMTEEIFGPLLPIITIDKIQESIDIINSRSKPLAIYAFTKDETLKRKILAETSSGSVVFNDALIQFLCDDLPFGGVGQSGFGRYHGKYSFVTFSHEKAVLQKGFFPEIEPRYPPWNSFKLKFIRLAYNFDYLGLLLLIMGLKR